MMTTEELDALETLRAKMTGGVWASHPDVPRTLVSSNDPHMSLLALDIDDTAVLYRKEDADGIAALVNAAPRLISAARDAATLRKELGQARSSNESMCALVNKYEDRADTAEMELMAARDVISQMGAERDALKAQRDELREAADVLTDVLLAAGDVDAFTPGWLRILDAMEAAR